MLLPPWLVLSFNLHHLRPMHTLRVLSNYLTPVSLSPYAKEVTECPNFLSSIPSCIHAK